MSNNNISNNNRDINESTNSKRKLSVSDESSDEEYCENEFEEKRAFLKISSYYFRDIRALKSEIEDVILKKIKNIDPIQNAELEKERYVYYFNRYCVDKVGNQVKLGETGIAEGWSIPLYVNEFQNLLGLPFTEDHALSETLRIKKPRQECFNCLSTNHRVQDCPVRIDDERIAMHRNVFTHQSIQAQEQAQLFSNRYTSDLDSKANRGYVPGKISDELREALGIRDNQLPPYIYIMRQYGYPIGWYIEARVKETSKLTVHDGDNNKTSENGEEGAIVTDEEEKNDQNKSEDSYVYDADKIYSFEGFNQPPGPNFIDESDKFAVRRYHNDFSREKFLSSLKLLDKKKVVKRRSMNKTGMQSSDDESSIEEIVLNENENNKSNSPNEAQEDDNVNKSDEADQSFDPYASPKKRLKKNDEHGKSFIEILGTPIVNAPIGTLDSSITKVPDWEKFSESICPHKPYEMDAQIPAGSYKNIVKLTREFKSSNNDNN